MFSYCYIFKAVFITVLSTTYVQMSDVSNRFFQRKRDQQNIRVIDIQKQCENTSIDPYIYFVKLCTRLFYNLLLIKVCLPSFNASIRTSTNQSRWIFPQKIVDTVLVCIQHLSNLHWSLDRVNENIRI